LNDDVLDETLTKEEIVQGAYPMKSRDYPLRLLKYTNKDGVNVFIIESMERTHDCDSDDYLISQRFFEPLPDVPLERYIDDELEEYFPDNTSQ
jgi:hypothetical protein